MISKRMLTKWRKEALQVRKAILDFKGNIETQLTFSHDLVEDLTNRVLYMTRELLDQLLEKE